MGSSLSTRPGNGPAWWRKRHRCGNKRESATTAGGTFFSRDVGGGGGGGMKLPDSEGEMMVEDELARVAGRMCTNGTSTAACLHTQQGRKGTNQDAMVVWERVIRFFGSASARVLTSTSRTLSWIFSKDDRMSTTSSSTWVTTSRVLRLQHLLLHDIALPTRPDNVQDQ